MHPALKVAAGGGSKSREIDNPTYCMSTFSKKKKLEVKNYGNFL